MKITNPIEIQNVIDHLVAQKLTQNESQVFWAWMRHSPDFHPQTQILARQTGLQAQNVSRAIKGLIQKNVLIRSGFSKTNKFKPTPVYDLHPSMLVAPQPKPAKKLEINPIEFKPLTLLKKEGQIDHEFLAKLKNL